MSFLGEIKRRRVVQVAVLYGVVAWGLVEIVATVEEPLGLPPWVDTLVIVLVLVGFPLALILSWAFDVTPQGVVRTPAPDEPDPGERPEPFQPTPVAAAATPKPEVLRNSVAILPLDNLSPNPDDAYFAAGIHEEILNYVAKIKDINVIARTSVKKYAGSEKSISEIAAELSVGTIMEGSVRYAGERVRVTAQLIDAATDNHLWSEVYERELADIFAIQADIAEKIAAALAAELSTAEKQNIEKLPTSVPEAYMHYLKAMVLFQEKGHFAGSDSDARSSIETSLDRALTADPELALAYAQRAKLYLTQLNQDPGTLENYKSRLEDLEAYALRDIDHALSIDSGIAEAHAALARIHQFNWRGKEAMEAYRRALEISPENPNVLTDFGVFLSIAGRFQEAVELGSRAQQLDPNGAMRYMWLAYIYLQTGDLAKALRNFRKTVELAPTLAVAQSAVAALEYRNGNESEARERMRIAEQLLVDDRNPVWFGELAAIYAHMGRMDDARRMFERLKERSTSHRIPAIAWIQCYAALEDRENLRIWLRRAVEDPEPYVGYAALMHVSRNAYGDPILAELEFAELRAQLGYKDLDE